MDDYFGKIVVLAPIKEREMSEFKIGDEVVCVDNIGVDEELTVGSSYKVVGRCDPWITLINDAGERLDYFNHRFKLATPTEQVVGISQKEYDEMYDRIELLESLLVDANKLIAELEAPKMVFNKPIEDYTMEDWQKAMEEHAVFETADGNTITLTRICESIGDDYPIETSRSSYTIQGYYYVGNANPQYNIIRRIK